MLHGFFVHMFVFVDMRLCMTLGSMHHVGIQAMCGYDIVEMCKEIILAAIPACLFYDFVVCSDG